MKKTIIPLLLLAAACQTCVVDFSRYPYDDFRETGYSTCYPPFMYKDAAVVARAAEGGNVQARFDLGVMYRGGYGIKQDDKKAVEWWTRAAEQGHARAQLYLGRMYDSGRSVSRDKEKARFWYEKAANQKDYYAKYYLGDMESLQTAAENGISKAQFDWGIKHRDGSVRRSVKNMPKKNYNLAVYWLEKAAEQGELDAARMLGYIYLQGGYGVEKNDFDAYVWFSAYQEINAEILENYQKNDHQEDSMIVADIVLITEPLAIPALALTQDEMQHAKDRILEIREKITQNRCRIKEAVAVAEARVPVGRCR